MTIRFLCPNGHPLTSQAQRAGGFGKCPQCGVAFQVPSGDGAGGEALRAEAIVSFSCPAGHHVRAPVRLAGQLGKCPTCEATFRVPATSHGEALPDFTSASASAKHKPRGSTAEASSGAANAQASAPPLPGPLSDQAAIQLPQGAAEIRGGGAESKIVTSEIAASEAVDESQSHSGLSYVSLAEAEPHAAHPMAALFEALWDGTQRDAIVDVYLTETERISPQHYAHDLSRSRHAVFAVLEGDGSQTLYLIPWDRVVRVAVRGLSELPPGLFD